MTPVRSLNTRASGSNINEASMVSYFAAIGAFRDSFSAMMRLKASSPILQISRNCTKFPYSSVLFSRNTHNGKNGAGDEKHRPKAPKGQNDVMQKGTHTEKNSVFKVESQSSKAAPAVMGAEISKLMSKDVKPYIPKLKHQRLSYEYPGLPNEDDFTKHTDKITKPKSISRWASVMPKIAVFVAVIWGAYVVKVWVYASDEDAESTELLDPNQFHKFIVTHKHQIDADHYLVEVRPKHNNWQYSYYAHYDNKSIWSGDKMWSVEVKQPDIMVVRSYTPLPLYFMKSEVTRAGKKEPLLRVIENDCEDYDKGGVMTFYIKKYNDGEVSRYIIDKNVGDELELRGPHVDYKFPHHPLNAFHERPIFRDLPSKVEAETLVEGIKRENGIPDYDNVDFFAAGTGIAPVLQVLLSRNPYRGFINVHYSAKSDTELGPLQRFIFFLEKLDRTKLISHIDSAPHTRLTGKSMSTPEPRNYTSELRKEMISEKKGNLSDAEKLHLRSAILSGAEDNVVEKDKNTSTERGPWYENALQQARTTSLQKKKNAASALVCGPDGYVEYVCGGKDLATGEQGPVGGLLAAKKWDDTNVYKL